MNKFFALAVALAALSACDDPAPSAPVVVEVPEETNADIDECPRADGQPCK